MSVHTFTKGDSVNVYNRSGEYFFEGRALIVRPVDQYERYQVRFSDGEVCERFVDPAGQGDAPEYAATLNQRVEIARA